MVLGEFIAFGLSRFNGVESLEELDNMHGIYLYHVVGDVIIH